MKMNCNMIRKVNQGQKMIVIGFLIVKIIKIRRFKIKIKT